MLNFERGAEAEPFCFIGKVEKKSVADSPDELTYHTIYPDSNSKFPPTLGTFCFPFPKNPIIGSTTGFTFCTVDSDKKLSYYFAFPRSLDQNTSVAYIVGSDYFHPDFLLEIVRTCASERLDSPEAVQSFIDSVKAFRLETHSYDWIFRGPSEEKSSDLLKNLSLCSPENEVGKLLRHMFTTFAPNYLLALITAVMIDCRIIVVSTSPEMLGLTCYGILALIYPLVWPGTFIPLCPEAMIAAIEAPFSYIIGVHSSLIDRLINEQVDQYFVLNCETHGGAIVGMDDFPADVIQECDRVSEEIRELFRSYRGIFPAAEIQIKLRNYMLTVLGNVLHTDFSNPQELYEALGQQREVIGEDFASFVSHSQFVNGIFRGVLEDGNVEIQEAIWPGFDFSSISGETINIDRDDNTWQSVFGRKSAGVHHVIDFETQDLFNKEFNPTDGSTSDVMGSKELEE